MSHRQHVEANLALRYTTCWFPLGQTKLKLVHLGQANVTTGAAGPGPQYCDSGLINLLLSLK